MRQKIIFRVILLLTIYTALSIYIGWNGWVWLHSAFGLHDKWIYSLIVGILSYSYIIGRSLKRMSYFRIIGSYWFAIIQYSLLIFPITNLIVWILINVGLREDTLIIWAGVGVLATFVFIFLYGTYSAYSPVVRTYSIVIPKHGNKRSNLRIAMASDMHFGTLSGLTHLLRLVEGVNNLQPDLILLPGDIIDDDPDPFIEKKMGDVMKELSAPLGVYGVLGNHEYYGGAIPGFVKEMERIGVTILQDEIIKVDDSFYLVGRKDKTDSKRQPMQDLITNISSSLPIIMMDHQPAEIKQAEKFGVDLLLSGHTHKGQMAPNHLITRKMYDLDWGHQKFNQLHAIVSSGFGFWGPPLRIGSRSEIVQIDITFLEA
jgi:uncharacterized protein